MLETGTTVKEFAESLLRMNLEQCRFLLKDQLALESGQYAVEEIITPALEKIGQGWENGNISLSQVYMAGRISERIVDELLPVYHSSKQGNLKIAIGVLEDYHALGKRMVISALRSSGYSVTDYGHGIKVDEMVSRALRDRVDILLVSCLMLSSALRVKEVVDKIGDKNRNAVIVVGGAPFRLDPVLWKETGAHHMGKNSADAVKIVNSLTEKGEGL